MQTRKKEAKAGPLTESLAHQIKNPLAIILQGINYLELELKTSSGPTKEVLQTMREAVKRADQIVAAVSDSKTSQSKSSRAPFPKSG